jgi:hypothetical protein
MLWRRARAGPSKPRARAARAPNGRNARPHGQTHPVAGDARGAPRSVARRRRRRLRRPRRPAARRELVRDVCRARCARRSTCGGGGVQTQRSRGRTGSAATESAVAADHRSRPPRRHSRHRLHACACGTRSACLPHPSNRQRRPGSAQQGQRMHAQDESTVRRMNLRSEGAACRGLRHSGPPPWAKGCRRPPRSRLATRFPLLLPPQGCSRKRSERRVGHRPGARR